MVSAEDNTVPVTESWFLDTGESSTMLSTTCVDDESTGPISKTAAGSSSCVVDETDAPSPELISPSGEDGCPASELLLVDACDTFFFPSCFGSEKFIFSGVSSIFEVRAVMLSC